jgi:cbb3-type cytochrome oxidase subunit 3
MQALFGLIVLLILTIGGWYFVFNEPARREQSKPGWELLRLNKEQRDISDSMNLVVALIVALTSSVILIVLLAVSIQRLFR